ncbi:MAG: tetratricopeptide repeat protein [Acidobacteriaceae bacterium]|nr:tetratricopeptide repeat protein [Acidobacteriaceae bacterium]
MKLFVVFGALLLPFAHPLMGSDFEEAAAAFERGDLRAAEVAVRSVLAKQPDDARALTLLGAVLDSEQKYQDAERAYRRALALAPNSLTLLNNYANHQMAVGDLNGARTSYLKVLAGDPTRANANLQLASISVRQKKAPEALRYLQHLTPADRSLPEVGLLEMQALFLARRRDEAQAILERLNSRSDPRLSFSAGLGLASIGEYNEAEIQFSRALEAAPANFDVLYNLGLAAYHATHYERARDVLQSALAQHPNDVDTLYNLAGVYIQLNQRDKALSLLAEAARIDPSRPNVQLSIAQTSNDLGYVADALAAYDRYLNLVPNDSSAQRERAFMLAASGDIPGGIAGLKRYLERYPNDPKALYEIGIAEALSDPVAAARHLSEAIRLQPDFVPARLGRGTLNFMQGKPALALPDLEVAAAHAPNNSTILDRLGETYLALDRADDAVKALQQAAALSPRQPHILLHLGRALAKSGRSQEARDVLAQFRSLPPEEGAPAPGIVDYLALPPEELHARYSAEVRRQIQQNPNNPTLIVRSIRLAVEEHDLKAAEEQSSHLLSLQPPAPMAAEAAHVLEGSGAYESARKLLEYATPSLPASAVEAPVDLSLALLHTAGAQPALAALKAIPEAQRNADFYLAQAEALEAAHNYDGALSAFKDGIRAAPSRTEVYERAALFLARHNRPAEAVSLLEEADRNAQGTPEILLMKAAMLSAASRADGAEEVLKQIQARWPEWAPAYVTYGILLEGENRAALAKKQLETAISLGGGTAQAYAYLARATLDATPDRVDEAAKSIEKALALGPEDPFVQATAGRVYIAQRKYELAVQHLEQAVRLRPDYAAARFSLAQAYRELGRKEDAARESREFQRLRAAESATAADPK